MALTQDKLAVLVLIVRKEHVTQCSGVAHLCVFLNQFWTINVHSSDEGASVSDCTESSIHCMFWSLCGICSR